MGLRLYRACPSQPNRASLSSDSFRNLNIVIHCMKLLDAGQGELKKYICPSKFSTSSITLGHPSVLLLLLSLLLLIPRRIAAVRNVLHILGWIGLGRTDAQEE